MYRSTRTALLALLALLAATSLAACRRKKPAEAPAPVPAATDDDAARRRREEAERAEAERRRLEEERLRAEREAAERARATARAALEATIYFEFDRSDLNAGAREALEAKLPVLQANPDVRIRIAGHTDERGSDEYNIALGQRRAAAGKRFLTQRGIDAGRIEIASLGEEQPTCTESTEECWRRNRRDEFSITSGTIASAPGRP
jgi:peptidoglycan-associated lipoprotein